MSLVLAIIIVACLRLFAFRGTNKGAFIFDLILVALIVGMLDSCGR